MAHLAQLSALTDELITVIANVPQNDLEKLKGYREAKLGPLRQHHFLRTNQFEVEEKLDGLVERFYVAGRDGLAKALRQRLDALKAHTTKWTPEILHLLLELSDQPAQKSKLSDLDLLWQEEEDPGPRLTWEEIAREDGWNEDRALWRNVDFTDNSEDELYVDEETEESVQSDSTSISTPERPQRSIQDFTTQTEDHEALSQVKESQAWRHDAVPRDADGRAKKIPLSELQALREVLFMLGGLETSLFDSNNNPVSNYQLEDVSWDAHKALFTSFAEHGRSLSALRRFSGAKQQVPLLQVFHSSVQHALRTFDQTLTNIQSRFVAIQQDVDVSLMHVLAELKPVLGPLNALSKVVQYLQEERNLHAFHYLDLLYDATAVAQLEGNEAIYKLLGTIFFDCFRIYLRPIRTWMEEGALVPGDRTFFVARASTETPLHHVWKDHFKLLRKPDGALHAPKFLQPAVKRIFAAGKSIVVLKHLGRFGSVSNRRQVNEPKMDFDSNCGGDLDFTPFPEAFSNAFDLWIESKHHTASATLRDLLFTSYGLASGLDSLQTMYLMSDGSQADAFAGAVFNRLDKLSSSWRDRFTLTEMAQEAFSTLDTFRLSAHLSNQGLVHSTVSSRSTVRLSLPAIVLTYQFNWPVQIILTEDAIQGYRRIFTFLFQLRRALFFLHKHHPSVTRTSHVEAAVTQGTYYLVRNKLLWFCTELQSYLTNLVITPSIAAMREGLRCAADVDEMIAVHSQFIERVLAGACLGPKLQPIREAMLDVLDLVIKLEDSHRVDMTKRAEEEQELSRLSEVSSPYKSPAKRTPARPMTVKRRRPREDRDEDEDDGLDLDLQEILARGTGGAAGKSYNVLLRDIHADFERNLRFVAGGLRGVARASRSEEAGKWDLLAEMMEVGIRNNGR